MYSATSFNVTHDTLTADGMEQSVDERTLFCTPAPLAASTIARDTTRMKQIAIPDIRGSFLSELSQLSLQSDSLTNLSQELIRPNISETARANKLPQAKHLQVDSGPDLIQFSGFAGKDGGTIDQDERTDSLTDVSSRSSMGLIPNELLTDLSSSLLPLNTPKGALQSRSGRPNAGLALSPCREVIGDSTEWSDNSKQDSKDMPMSRSHLVDTVKKKPQLLEEHAAQFPGHGKRPLAFIAGSLLDNVEEGNEHDNSVYNVEFGAEELRQLDEDFSDLDDKSSLEDNKESDDYGIGLDDDPFLGLPSLNKENKGTDAQNSGTDSRANNVDKNSMLQIQDELESTLCHVEEENRLGGQEYDKDGAGNYQIFDFSKSGLRLDACYFHKTPVPFPGEGEDVEATSVRNISSMTSQRGGAEGENLAKLRQQLISDDGSKVDNEDELEVVREEMALSARQSVQGADSADDSRSDLPQPVGLERGADFTPKSVKSHGLTTHQNKQQFSFLVRQSAEGHSALSPFSGHNGGPGDGNSRVESDDGSATCHTKRNPENQIVTSGFPDHQITVGSRQPNLDLVTVKDRQAEESGLQAAFFMPTSSQRNAQDHDITGNPPLESSSFHVEDILRHSDPSASCGLSKKAEENCLEVGPVAISSQKMPHEDHFAAMESSFGSFGLENTDSEDKLFDAGDNRLADTHTQAETCAPKLNERDSFEDSFKRPLTSPCKRKGKGRTSDQDLKSQLLALGIDIGEENFQTADSAIAILAADEEQFEHENKFSEHHQLGIAAESLTWQGNDTTLSGYLGDDKPEHLEMSITSYMATRTEALGRLGGGDGVLRPEFGNPVYSPPHKSVPLKLMSPSSCSTLLLDSRTQGEGNEHADRTVTSGNTAAIDETSFTTCGHSQGIKKSLQDQEVPERELSSLLADLTHGNTTDLSLEDPLSLSSVVNFVKQHNFSQSSNFAQAVLKFSNSEKQQVYKNKTRNQLPLAKDSSKTYVLKEAEPVNVKIEGTVTKSIEQGMKSSAASCVSNSLTSPRDATSPQEVRGGKGSRLPIRRGSSVTRTVEKTEGSMLHSDLKNQSSKSLRPQSSLQQTAQSAQITDAQGRTVSRTPVHSRQPEEPDTSKRRHRDYTASDVKPVSVQAFMKKGGLLDEGQDHVSGEVPSSKPKQSPSKSTPNPGKEVSRQNENVTRSTMTSSCKKGFHSATDLSLTSADCPSHTESFALAQQKQTFHASFEHTARHQTGAKNTRVEMLPGSKSRVTYELPLNVPLNVQKDKHRGEKANIGLTQERAYSAGDGLSDVYSDRRVSHKAISDGSLVKEQIEKGKVSEISSHSLSALALTPRVGATGKVSPRGRIPDQCIPDCMEDSRVASKPGIDQEAAHVENLTLMESRQFELVADGEVADQNGQAKTEPGTAQQTVSDQLLGKSHLTPVQRSEQGVADKPVLLTGSSLLQTEFAQRHLSHRHLIQKVTAEHQNQNYGQQHSQPASSVMVLPSSSLKQLNEPDASVYYELNEDFHQTTVLGSEMPESSVMGSFWGKSPLCQSTPAFEMGKMAATSLMSSKLDERDLTAGGTKMVTPRVQRPLVDVQRVVMFRDFCCLGVSEKTWFSVTNKTPYTLVCRLQVLQLIHNNRRSKLDVYNPFELKSKISIAPEASEDIPVLFVPKCPGDHVAHVELSAQSLNPAFAPTTTIIQLRAVAEAPNIQISPSVEVLEFGEVMWGTCQTKSIKLRNINRASLPIRLSIWSSNSLWHCFTFDNSATSSDISIVSLSSRPETLGRNIITVQVPGCDTEGEAKVVEIRLYCKPPSKELNRALADRPAEKIEAKVAVEVDTPVQYLPALATLTLQAVIGMPYLLIPPTHMSLKFKTKPDRTIQESISLNNSGNISMELTIGVTTFPDCFQVKPRHVTIKPRTKAEITVTFSPLEKGVNKYQSLLLLDVEPCGPSYELPMEAHVTQPVTLLRTPPSILTNCTFLSFNGVALNQTKNLMIRLLNNDSQKAEHVLLEVKGAVDCFKLVTSTGEWRQRSDLVIRPKEKHVVTVIFCPSAVQGYSGKLVIKIRDSGTSKYSIPLAGYGGHSALMLSGACLTNYSQTWLELGPLTVGHNIMREVVLTNSGVRAAFVKACAFYDMACRKPVQPGHVAVEPNNIVLGPGTSVKVMVAISPSKREREIVKEKKEMIAVVRFQHGDEVMRQKYRKVLTRERREDVISWQASFAQQFANESQESVMKEGCTIPDSPDDGSAFLHHLSDQTVALLAEPHPERGTLTEPDCILGSQKRSPLSCASSGDAESVVSRDTLKQYDPSGQFLIPDKPGDAETDWSVKPDFLTLTVEESNQKMLQLLNFSNSTLRFELSWPPNSVVPEPQRGEVKPRSSCSIEVWLHMAWQKRIAELPWRGNLTVTCNGKKKCIKVHIKNSASEAVISPTSTRSVSKLPGDASLSSLGSSLQVSPTNIHFSCASVNKQHESLIWLTNVSADPVHWKVSAFGPAYVKGADENNTVQRAGYSIFQIIPASGDLLPNESSKVPVRFCPMTRGTYNQHWEVECQPLAPGKSFPAVTVTTIFITAEASSKDNPVTAKHIVDKGNAENGKPPPRTPLQEKQPNTMPSGEHHSTAQDLLLLNPEVRFCDTVVGKVTQVKAEFKNSYDINIQLETQPPKLPFLVKHLQFGITKRRFLKYPIEFRPSAPGDFEDTIIFRASQLNKTFAVHLMGRGVEDKIS